VGQGVAFVDDVLMTVALLKLKVVCRFCRLIDDVAILLRYKAVPYLSISAVIEIQI